MSSPANKLWKFRGAGGHGPVEVTRKDISGVSQVAWKRWGIQCADIPIRDLVGLVYAEGLYHGAMLAKEGDK